MTVLKHLFSPATLGTMEIDSRLVMPPMSVNFGIDEDGHVTEQHREYLAQRAAGGTRMITVGGGAVDPDGLDLPRMPRVWNDSFIPSLEKLTEVVKRHGARIGMQLLHGGRQAYQETKVAPSPLESLGVVHDVPRELTAKEIVDVIAAHGDAAGRCQRAGFDFVEIHGAHGYLISEFLSPSRNQRTDRYGGDLQRRSRFAVEVLAAVRAAVGPEYPVAIKLNAHDYLDGSTTEVDSAFLASALAEAGIDLIEVSGGTPGSGRLSPARSRIATAQDEAYFLEQARAIRAAAPGVALALVGGLRSLERIQAILDEGVVEYLALARPLVREPGLPRRWAQGDTDRAACISCSGCFVPTGRGEGLRCVRATST